MVELADTQASEACFLNKEVGVQLSLAAQDISGYSSSVERSVWDREAGGPIPLTPTKLFSVDGSVICLNIEETVKFWPKTTGIAKDQFGKTYIDGRKKSKTKSVKKLSYGTAYLNVRANGNKEFGMRLFRRIIRSIEVVKLNFNAGMV